MLRPEADSTVSAGQTLLDREQAEALHAEIDRLPASSRLPVVLCYFEGLSLAEAARRLRCPAGTVHSRLVRAQREAPARPVAPRLGALDDRAGAATRPRRPSHPSCAKPRPGPRSPSRPVTPPPGHPPAALAQEVLRTMMIHKLKLTVMSLLLLATVATGAGWLAGSLAMAEPRQAPRPQVAAKPEDSPRPAPGRMFVAGRVLDPQGRPVPGAVVAVCSTLKQPGNYLRFGLQPQSAIGRAGSDGSGRFRIDAPRTASSVHEKVRAVAIAPGYGAGWVELDPDADQPTVDIALRPEQIIQGRLFDLHGRPAGGVRVSVDAMGHSRRGPDARPDLLDDSSLQVGNDGNALPAWPSPATTDADGRFTVRGVGRDLRIILMADDPRFARQRIVIDTGGAAELQPVTTAMEPAKVFTGRVTYGDTGKPAPHAAVGIISYQENRATFNVFETDAEGRYRGNPLSTNRYMVWVYAPEGEPYLDASAGFIEWTKGAVERRVDVVLTRGTVIHGKVTEEGSGRPVAGAMVGYHGRPYDGGGKPGPQEGRTQTGPDGSYRIAALPRPGTLAVVGPSEDYVSQVIGQRTIMGAGEGGNRWYAHAFIPCDIKPGTEAREVNVVLRRTPTVKLRVIGPDDQPVQEAWMFSRIVRLSQPVPRRIWAGYYHGDVRDGHCEIHGLPPDAEVPVHFLDVAHELGATVLLSGRSAADGPATVRLQPCGAARARLVDPAGKPVPRARDSRVSYTTMMVVTPGPHRVSRDRADQDRLAADQDSLARIDPVHYENGPVSDGQGRLALPALIPGATYRIYDTSARGVAGPRLRKEFTVKPGETLDLGDIVIGKIGVGRAD